MDNRVRGQVSRRLRTPLLRRGLLCCAAVAPVVSSQLPDSRRFRIPCTRDFLGLVLCGGLAASASVDRQRSYGVGALYPAWYDNLISKKRAMSAQQVVEANGVVGKQIASLAVSCRAENEARLSDPSLPQHLRNLYEGKNWTFFCAMVGRAVARCPDGIEDVSVSSIGEKIWCGSVLDGSLPGNGFIWRTLCSSGVWAIACEGRCRGVPRRWFWRERRAQSPRGQSPCPWMSDSVFHVGSAHAHGSCGG